MGRWPQVRQLSTSQPTGMGKTFVLVSNVLLCDPKAPIKLQNHNIEVPTPRSYEAKSGQPERSRR